jgi:polysaccharide pyruvyl transferase WcaK-like protein
VGEAVKRFLANSGVATIPLDTLICENRAGLSTAAQLEALIRSCDVVLTSRLHGMVYSLKNGVPAVAIDAIAGGAKIAAQARTLGWPFILDGDCVTAELIAKNVCDALKSEVRELVRSVTARAQTRIEGMRAEIVLAFNGG